MNYLIDLLEFIGEEELTSEILTDPSNKETCFILYLWSMESPFAHELVKFYSEEDEGFMKHVQYFGPIERAVQEILNGAETLRIDRIFTSSTITTPTSFLIFKGGALTEEEIQVWRNNTGNSIELTSNTSFT